MTVRSGSQGFTLLELVAALAIFALMSVMAYGGIGALINTQEGLDSSYERLQNWQLATHRLRLDLTQVRQRPVRDAFGDIQPAFHEPEEGRVEFTYGGRRNPLQLTRSTLQRVAWFLDTDGSLIRQSWLNLDRAQSEEPLRATVLEDIETLEWRFLTSDDEWVEDWPPAQLSDERPQDLAPPRAVEMMLESKRLGDLNFIFATGVES